MTTGILQKRWAALVAKVLVTVAVGISMVSAVTVFRGDLQAIAAAIHLPMLLLAALLTMTYRILNAANWGLVLRSIGANLSIRQSTRIWLTSEACRWLPGSLWSYGSRGLQAKAAGVSGSLASLSLPVEMVLTLFAWVTTAALCGAQHVKAFTSGMPDLVGSTSLAIVVGIVAVVPACLWLVVRAVARRRAQHKSLRKLFRGVRFTKSRMIAAAFHYLALCALNGLALFVVIHSIQPAESIPISAVISANALAWLIGFFALFAPGGILVREGALATLLVCWMPLETAIAVSVLWRVLQLGVEILCLAALPLVRMATGILFCRSILKNSTVSTIV